jgi:hypothetical protein
LSLHLSDDSFIDCPRIDDCALTKAIDRRQRQQDQQQKLAGTAWRFDHAATFVMNS